MKAKIRTMMPVHTVEEAGRPVRFIKAPTSKIRFMFQVHSREELEFFLQRAIEEEEYELCSYLQQALAEYFTPAA